LTTNTLERLVAREWKFFGPLGGGFLRLREVVGVTADTAVAVRGEDLGWEEVLLFWSEAAIRRDCQAVAVSLLLGDSDGGDEGSVVTGDTFVDAMVDV
jgi:hypothetical protein